MALFQQSGRAPAYTVMALCIAFSTQAADWGTYEWEVACIDPTDCAPADEIYAQQLKSASEWLAGLGFPAPAAFNSLDMGYPALEYRVANISDSDIAARGIDLAGYYGFDERMIWLRSDDYFTVGDPGQAHDDPLYQVYNTLTIASVHELFHAVQNAGEYTLPRSPEFRWLWEGTATAVMLAYGREVEPDTEVMFRRRRHDFPLHEPNLLEDAYGTAFFWLFLGTELQSTARIAYLDQLLRIDGSDEGGEGGADVWDATGVRGVDKFLKPYGGLFALFPRFLATLPVDGTFGGVAQWQARLPAGQTQAMHHFRGNVREIAGTAARLSVAHSSAKPVAVEIRFRGDDSDLHLVVDGEVRVLGPGGVRNVFTTQMQSRSQTFELIIAEVAEQAELSADQTFELEVEVRELGCYWAADVSGVLTANMGGEAMATSFTKAGTAISNTINYHHPPAVDAFRLVTDPDTPLTLTLGFPDDLKTGSFEVSHAVLWGRSFQLSDMGTGTMRLTVKRNEQFEPPAATVQPSGYNAFGQWSDAGIASVTGEFSVIFDGIQSWMTGLEREGSAIVNGRFAWTPECANALDRRQQAGQPPREPSLTRELREGLLEEGIRQMYPTPPPLPNQ